MKTEAQLSWLIDAPPDKKPYRAMVVGWQNSSTAINHLVSTFNDEYLKSPEDKNSHHGMKEIAIKKLIVSSIVEMKCKVDEWAGKLNKDGEDTQAINQERKANRALLDKAEQLRDIRNIGFHYGDVMLSADEMIQIYQATDQWNLQELNDILGAIYKVGNLAKDIALKKT